MPRFMTIETSTLYGGVVGGIITQVRLTAVTWFAFCLRAGVSRNDPACCVVG